MNRPGIGILNQNIGLDDTVNAENNIERVEKNDLFTIINTNARSLCPKIHSLTDCMDEMDASLAIVTETWMREDRMDAVEEESIGGLVTESSVRIGIRRLMGSRTEESPCFGGKRRPISKKLSCFRATLKY